jgi:hypothetical protein
LLACVAHLDAFNERLEPAVIRCPGPELIPIEPDMEIQADDSMTTFLSFEANTLQQSLYSGAI